MNCRGFARVDTFMKEDESIILNEINTIPGFTSTSHFPSMMKAVGIEYGDLIDKLVELHFVFVLLIFQNKNKMKLKN